MWTVIFELSEDVSSLSVLRIRSPSGNQHQLVIKLPIKILVSLTLVILTYLGDDSHFKIVASYSFGDNMSATSVSIYLIESALDVLLNRTLVAPTGNQSTSLPEFRELRNECLLSTCWRVLGFGAMDFALHSKRGWNILNQILNTL